MFLFKTNVWVQQNLGVTVPERPPVATGLDTATRPISHALFIHTPPLAQTQHSSVLLLFPFFFECQPLHYFVHATRLPTCSKLQPTIHLRPIHGQSYQL